MIRETIESLQRFAAEYFCDIALIQNMSGTILYVNPSVQKITGWSQDEVRSKPFVEWIHPEDRFRALQIFASSGKEGAVISREWRVLCKSGEHIWLETKISTIYNDENIPRLLVLCSRDITVRKKFELELLKSEERLRLLIEKSPAGIAIIRDGKFLFMSQKGMRLLCYKDPDELIGHPFEMIIAPSQKEEIMETYQKMIKGITDPNSREMLVIRKDGREFLLRVSAAMIHLADGPATICYYRDVSKEKRNNEVLQKSEEQCRFALEGNRDGFFDWNIETGSVVYSCAYAEIIGYKADEMEPNFRAWKALLHPEDKPLVVKTLQDHLEGRTDFYESEHRLQTKSGNYKWVYARGRVMKRDLDGKPLRMNGTHHDISGRKQMEEELRSAKENLEKRVADRTRDLNEANTALKVMLKQSEMNRSEIERRFVTNIRNAMHPHINRLKGAGLSGHQIELIEIIEKDLMDVMSPFLKNLKILCPSLTPREIEIAAFIRNGKNSKDIAEQLSIGVKTVDLIRFRIRKKLNINKRNIKLGAHLISISMWQ